MHSVGYAQNGQIKAITGVARNGYDDHCRSDEKLLEAVEKEGFNVIGM
jgi:hypothetical protein